MDDTLYHVLLEGRRVGPYDRRTIVGMRIKKTLTSKHVLVDSQGRELTVGDLVKKPPADDSFEPSRSGSYSVVQARYSAWLAQVEGKGFEVPRFRGELEVRVQTKVLRLSGRYREGFNWKDGRVKVPLEDVVHSRLRGSLVDLWVREQPGRPLQRLALELFTPESAGELMRNLPHTTPWPEDTVAPAPRAIPAPAGHPVVWGAVAATALVVGTVLVWALVRRF